DWCAGHGLPESHCRKCNPGLSFAAAVPKDWCKEHAVPESKCTRCNPALVAKFIEAGDYCREHGYPASVCPIHHPEQVKAAGESPPRFPTPGTKVRLASAEAVREAGIETTRIDRRRLARTLEVVGQLAFDQNRLAQLSARGEAQVLEVKVDVGDEVKAGQALATLGSAAVGSGQAQIASLEARLRAARSAVDREEALVKTGVSPRKNLEAAQTALATAEGDLRAARAVLSAAGASSAGTGGRYVLTAPFDGTVVARDAVIGRSASPGQTLLEIADLSTMWALLDLPEAEAGQVRPGQRVRLEWEGGSREAREATITRVASSVDRATRAVRARVEVKNPDRSLKAGAFLRAKVEVASEHEALVLPRGAVQRAEGHTLVFVKEGPTVFVPVAVELGAGSAEWVEVLKGVAPGAEVVTTGAFLLKTEILKESIGAGCCDEGGK
ncbi:MAG: efflux RND transporter periplasmic adaptor subunit, partial [Myxococcaceae bacterium]